jgi:hypothetical protein
VEKGLASDRVRIDTVVAKYSDHLPPYRQEAMLKREAGVEISRATLDGWLMRVGELPAPTTGAVRRSGANARWSWSESARLFVAIRKPGGEVASGKGFGRPTAMRGRPLSPGSPAFGVKEVTAPIAVERAEQAFAFDHLAHRCHHRARGFLLHQLRVVNLAGGVVQNHEQA